MIVGPHQWQLAGLVEDRAILLEYAVQQHLLVVASDGAKRWWCVVVREFHALLEDAATTSLSMWRASNSHMMGPKSISNSFLNVAP